MELNASAFSADGYLISQKQTENLPFGACNSRQTGCGWIAAYNLLHATLHPIGWDQVRRDLSRRLLFEGTEGLHLFTLVEYLREQGCRMKFSCTLTGSRFLADECKAGILMYGTKTSSHYVAFVSQKNGTLRFLNAGEGREDVTMTLRDFYRDVISFPIFCMIAAYS